jgi:tetratricopeptide (TPR) repeat protein
MSVIFANPLLSRYRVVDIQSRLPLMPRDLHTDMQTLNTVLTLAQHRDFERAAALAEKTLASGFEHPLLLNVVATRLEQQGRFEDSLRLLERAVALAPNDVGARNALSMVLQRLDRPVEALEHLDQLLKLNPSLSFAHANRGNALISLGLLARAKQSHLRALELDPANFIAMAALGSIATHRGEHAEARRWAEQTLVVSPGFPDAVLSLAAAELAGGATARAETLLQGLIMDARAGPSDRARASGLLGDVLDAAARYTEAFDAYSTCNEALRHIHRRFAEGPGMLAYVASLTAALGDASPHRGPSRPAPAPPAHPAQPAQPATPGEPREHVFLLGFPRSGTTLLEVILDGHPEVASLEEHELLTVGVRQFMREPVDLQPLLGADENQLKASRVAYWDGVRHAGVDVAGKVFVDKHPLNTLKLPLIARLFPRARVLFACRDPRDVVLSCFRRRFAMNPAMYELLTLSGAADFYAAVMGFADMALPLSELAWRTVRYESLVSDFERETASLCEFLNLEPVATMGDFAGRVQARDRATPSTAQLARGLTRSAIEIWRHYEKPLEAILPVLDPWVERFGYRVRCT